jgi:hypothetical protein
MTLCAPGKPSAVFRTGWPTNPDVAMHPVVQVGANCCCCVCMLRLPPLPSLCKTACPATRHPPLATPTQIGVSVEPADTVKAVLATCATAESERLAYAQLVARDLFNYISSFAKVTRCEGGGAALCWQTNPSPSPPSALPLRSIYSSATARGW